MNNVELPANCNERCLKQIIDVISTNKYFTPEQKQMLINQYEKEFAIVKLRADIKIIMKDEEKRENEQDREKTTLLSYKKRKAD
jgi:hypothetical protein